MKFPNRLAQLRGDASQADFAKSLGLSQQNYGNYEKGKQGLKSDLIRRICLSYDCSAEWLLCFDEEDEFKEKKAPLFEGMNKDVNSICDERDMKSEKTIRERVARNIKRFRIERRLSVDEVGGAVGKSGKTISAWEVGRGQPDADGIIKLCEFFNVDIYDFFGMTEQRNDLIKRTEKPTIGDVLREKRKAKRLSCAAVGGILGVSEATVSAWERGQNDVNGKMLLKLCALYDACLEDFNQEPGVFDLRLKELTGLYNQMSETGKDSLLACAEGLCQAYPRQKSVVE